MTEKDDAEVRREILVCLAAIRDQNVRIADSINNLNRTLVRVVEAVRSLPRDE